MRSILILVIFGTLLFLPRVNFAETNAECIARCDAEKAAREANCPPPEETSEKEHAQCLKEADDPDTYNNCVNSCPPPETIVNPNEN